MTKNEKREFIDSFVRSVWRDVVDLIPKMPEEWDGHQLRVYIIDKFKEQDMETMTHAELTEYRNTVLINNL